MALIYPYCRYSPRPEYSDARGETIKSPSNTQQFALITEWAGQNGHTIACEPFCDEHKSRDDLDREKLWACVDACQRGALLAATDLDRIGDLLAIELAVYRLRKRGAKLATVATGIETDAEDREMLRNMRGMLSKAAKRKIGYATSQHMRVKQSSGLCMSRHAPYGMKIVLGEPHPRRGHPQKLLVPDRSEQTILARIQELAALGYKSHRIATTLDAEGLECRGREWVKARSLIEKLLQRATAVR